MGGTMHHFARLGPVVHMVMMVGDYRNAAGDMVEMASRRDDATRAAEFLNVSGMIFCDFEENTGDMIRGDMVRAIDTVIELIRPRDVFTCLPWFNQDHDAVHMATVASMRRYFAARFWAYELPAQGLGYHMPEHGWAYRVLDDEDQMAKATAIACYENTQKLVSKDGPVSLDGATALAQMRGSELGVAMAERQLLLRGVF